MTATGVSFHNKGEQASPNKANDTFVCIGNPMVPRAIWEKFTHVLSKLNELSEPESRVKFFELLQNTSEFFPNCTRLHSITF